MRAIHRKNGISLTFCIWLIACGLWLVPQTAYSAEYCSDLTDTSPLPVYNNVDQIVVVVNILPSSHATLSEQRKLPKSLQKANLEFLLKTLYEERFKKIPDRECEDRKNQAVKIVDSNNVDQREQLTGLSKEFGTLTVLLNVNFSLGKYIEPKIETDLVSIQLTNYRFMPEYSPLNQLSIVPAISFPLNSSEKFIESKVEGYIKDRLRY